MGKKEKIAHFSGVILCGVTNFTHM